MNYNYEAKQNYYKYLASGVKGWDLLLPDNVGLKKGDTVTVIEVDSNGEETGRATIGTIRFSGHEGFLTVKGNQSYYYLTNITTANMYTLLRGTITQTGTDIPVITILENTTGLSPVLGRDDIGSYGITNIGIVDASKVVVLLSTSDDSNIIQLATAFEDSYDIHLQSFLGAGNPYDGLLTNAGIDIKIYP